MARLPRLSIGGQVHVLVQRVRRGESVFADAADRQAFLRSLGDAAAAHGVALHGYGLSASEVRWIATPPDAQALGRMVQHIGRRFVADFNRRHHRQGGVWEGRFRSSVIEADLHFLSCLRFVEMNDPTAATEAASMATVPWSSAPHHVGRRLDTFIQEHARFWALGNTPFERQAAYAELSVQPLDGDAARGITLACLHGWAFGSDAFKTDLASAGARRVAPLRPGRPPAAKRPGH